MLVLTFISIWFGIWNEQNAIRTHKHKMHSLSFHAPPHMPISKTDHAETLWEHPPASCCQSPCDNNNLLVSSQEKQSAWKQESDVFYAYLCKVRLVLVRGSTSLVFSFSWWKLKHGGPSDLHCAARRFIQTQQQHDCLTLALRHEAKHTLCTFSLNMR